jgi:CYTH domain-containing protein
MTLDRGLDEEMAEPKYAHVELERRWLVDSAARSPLDACYSTFIEDRYIDGTRIRLRRMSRPDLGETKWKLTKKYEAEIPEARPIVTTYLTQAEFDVLCRLQGSELAKRRYHLRFDGRDWSVDVFEGALEGLEVLECEAEDRAALDQLTPPPWALREVTHLSRWQCGALAAAQARPE